MYFNLIDWEGFSTSYTTWFYYLYLKCRFPPNAAESRLTTVKIAIKNDICFVKKDIQKPQNRGPVSGSIFFDRPYKYHDPYVFGLIVGFNYSVRQIT